MTAGLRSMRIFTGVRTFTRPASTDITPARTISAYDAQELEPSSAFKSSAVSSTTYDPVSQARRRGAQLPSSRYKFRPPRYYRGPLHPHQPPKKTDIASREFQPGPFSAPRLAQTYASTIAPDIMTLTYQHFPPGYEAAPKSPRLRSWDESSPYHKNRPLRGPRGGDALRLPRKPITFRNVPRLTRLTVHSSIEKGSDGSAPVQVASMALQAITGVRCTVHKEQLRSGPFTSPTVAVKAELTGEDMYNFLAKTVDVAMPRIKDWRGLSTPSGESGGNLSFGMTSDEVAHYPEIEVNYDAYPPKLIPGCQVTVRTSANSDRDARLLLTALGIPFQTK